MRVFECFKLLRPGLFVKCWADGDEKEPLPKPIYGEIGVVDSDCFYIFWDRSALNEHLLEFSGNGNFLPNELVRKKGYDDAWIVFKNNINKIEIIDKLPEEAELKVPKEKEIKLPGIVEQERIAAEFVKKLIGLETIYFSDIKIVNNEAGVAGVIDFDKDVYCKYTISVEFEVE
jgi:hypothetical protein